MERLPAGRHHMTRDEVAAHQRRRIFEAMATVMAEKGFANTTVSDIITRAHVSRPTFYEYFSSKQDCFMAGYARLQERMVATVVAAPRGGTPMERFEVMLGAYLAAIAAHPVTSRVYLVETYAAGAEAMQRRLRMQGAFVDGVAAVFAARSKRDVFACQSLVATTSTLVTQALIDGDVAGVLALHEPILALAARLHLDRSVARATDARL
ncbi:TetR/AcrR family transcriptional regulator [Mycolicibacterium grossiae]|uniref:TetR family transcriptional regulator n=2 Tax=Mycolicibacterium grossiae TaxID=1552759 RepID=A0A1E8QAL4_9MYCO|nr:TetR family transcriptional regulator [Mycolicibacterium grossiae]QEM48188.1 TetR/AcrR family transcriptional regulator [Mycolicibacterium grossiae]